MIGVITGLRSEARCLPPAADRAVVCAGACAERAGELATALVERGARGLISFGIAGGLDPAVRPGNLVLPEAVVLPGGQRIPIDRAWRERLAARLRASGIRVHEGLLAGSDRLLASAPEKLHLHGMTGAVAADQESHGVAEVAARAQLPFAVIRAIADPLEQPLPDAVRGAIGPQGEVRLLPVLRALRARPDDLRPLLRLGWQSARAHATLRRVALLAGPALDLD